MSSERRRYQYSTRRQDGGNEGNSVRRNKMSSLQLQRQHFPATHVTNRDGRVDLDPGGPTPSSLGPQKRLLQSRDRLAASRINVSHSKPSDDDTYHRTKQTMHEIKDMLLQRGTRLYNTDGQSQLTRAHTFVAPHASSSMKNLSTDSQSMANSTKSLPRVRGASHSPGRSLKRTPGLSKSLSSTHQNLLAASTASVQKSSATFNQYGRRANPVDCSKVTADFDTAVKATTPSWDIDQVSGQSMNHLSFILGYLLPLEFFQPWVENLQKTAEEEAKRVASSVGEGLGMAGQYRAQLTGAVAEGLVLPQIYPRTQSTSSSDSVALHTDVLLLDSVIPTVSVKLHPDNPNPAFVSFSELQARSAETLDRAEYFLFNAHPRQGSFTNLKETAIMPNVFLRAPLPVLAVSPWPAGARGFLSRPRAGANPWPGGRLLVEAARAGAVLSPTDPTIHSEADFRLQFPAAEAALVAALTPIQRQVFLLLKLMVRYCSSIPSFATVYLKHSWLWSCERLSDSYWTWEKLAPCLMQLLDQLIAMLKRENIPNFFIPECNLISNLSGQEIRDAVNGLTLLRKDPLGCILKFDKSYVIHPVTLANPASVLFRTIIADMKSGHGNLRKSRRVMQEAEERLIKTFAQLQASSPVEVPSPTPSRRSVTRASRIRSATLAEAKQHMQTFYSFVRENQKDGGQEKREMGPPTKYRVSHMEERF